MKTATVRVAIYTRQSVATDLEYGSIDAQREAGEAYTQSQRSQGWQALEERYDDHGFSGGDTDRPAFQRLVADVEAGKVDVIVCYKTDRISRSLADFTRFMETLDRLGVGFVSITQSFDTRTSMGRLTLNILASFSQFERETIAERTRDKIAATRRKGMWTGGRPPLGFDVVDKALVINGAEAEVVRLVFQTYLQQGGLVATVAELQRRGIRNKSWTNKAGKPIRGAGFDKGTLRNVLTNPLYVGKIRCGKEVVDGRHEAIVDEDLWQATSAMLNDHRKRGGNARNKHGALLAGLLRCARCGSGMAHHFTVRGNRTFRYYVCATIQKRGASACPKSRAPAAQLDEVVSGRIRAIGQDPEILLQAIAAKRSAGEAQKPELIADSRRLQQERALLLSQRTNLLDAIANGGTAAGALLQRLSEVDERVAVMQHRMHEVRSALVGLDASDFDEDALRRAFADFTPVWDALFPKERARILRLLIDEVVYDGQVGELQIRFRDSDIKALAREIRSPV